MYVNLRGLGELGQGPVIEAGKWMYPTIAPAVPMDPENRVFRLRAHEVFYLDPFTPQRAIALGIAKGHQEATQLFQKGELAFAFPRWTGPKTFRSDQELRLFLYGPTGDTAPNFLNYGRNPPPMSVWWEGVELMNRIRVPIKRPDDLPPVKLTDTKAAIVGRLDAWYAYWWSHVLTSVMLDPTPTEKRVIAAAHVHNPVMPGPGGPTAPSWAWPDRMTNNLWWSGGVADRMPSDIYPRPNRSDPIPFSEFLPYVLNQETIREVRDEYPWPGPMRFFWQAFMENASGEITGLIRRKRPLLTKEEVQDAITLLLLERWDKIADRVNALFEKYQKKKARHAMRRMIAISVIGLAAGAAVAALTAGVASVALKAALSAGLKKVSDEDRAQAARGLLEMAEDFQESEPKFAAEIARVANKIGLATPGTVAIEEAAAEPAVPGWVLPVAAGVGAAAVGLGIYLVARKKK